MSEFRFINKDKYGDKSEVQAHAPDNGAKGSVFLELFDENGSTLHMYRAKHARRLATSLLVAANIAEGAIAEID